MSFLPANKEVENMVLDGRGEQKMNEHRNGSDMSIKPYASGVGPLENPDFSIPTLPRANVYQRGFRRGKLQQES